MLPLAVVAFQFFLTLVNVMTMLLAEYAKLVFSDKGIPVVQRSIFLAFATPVASSAEGTFSLSIISGRHPGRICMFVAVLACFVRQFLMTVARYVKPLDGLIQ